MPLRATKRGPDRTPLEDEDYDVVICGASFAGLAVARELRHCEAKVLVLDRYEIGERATSACATPTGTLIGLNLGAAIRQTFDSIVVHTSKNSTRLTLPWTFSTFDYAHLCRLLFDQGRTPNRQFETAKVNGRTGNVVHTDRGDIRGRFIIDALGWRRILGTGSNIQPPDAMLSRGLEIHPKISREEMEVWIDRRYVPAGYCWSFPATDETRIGVGSFDPMFHVKEPTLRLANDLNVEAVNYQGNWIPHQIREPIDDGVFFVGDSAGHCLPLTAEGIRTALYFGIYCGREIRRALMGYQSKEEALTRYQEFSNQHRRYFRILLRCQKLLPHIPPFLLSKIVRLISRRSVSNWAFSHYLGIALPKT